jgi:hypothetical protein
MTRLGHCHSKVHVAGANVLKKYPLICPHPRQADSDFRFDAGDSCANTFGVLHGSGPRDPDKFEADVDARREFRMRYIPRGLTNEVLLDVYVRVDSFEPGVPCPQRFFDAYAAKAQRVDSNGDGVIWAVEGDIDTASDGFKNMNACTCRPPGTTASQSRASSTTGSWRRASRRASAHG